MIEKSIIDYEKAVLIGLITQKQNADKSNEYLDELEFLTYTAGGEVLKRFVQKMESPNSKTFLGSEDGMVPPTTTLLSLFIITLLINLTPLW